MALRSAFSRPVFRTSLAGGLILLLCLLAYLPAIQGKFLWDDLYLVGTNPFFRSPRFLLEVFRHYLFIDSFSLYYRPVQNISYIVDYLFWNNQEFGYHLSNILFHAASAFLLFLVLRRHLRGLPAGSALFGEAAAFSIGLLWAVHPVHNAAVAYVAGRADSIAMMFALAGWLLFLEEQPGWRRLASRILAPLCFLAALCAKEIAFIWIGLFLVYVFAFEPGRSLRGKLGLLGSLLAVLGVYLVLRHLPGSRLPPQGMEATPFSNRVLLMFAALGDYATLIFFPGNLHMERTVWDETAYGSLASWQQNLRGDYLTLAGLATIGLFVLACWSKLPGRQIRIFGVTWFVLGFLPISNLFQLNAQVAEHWIYMASAGFLLMLAGFAVALPARWQRGLAMAVPLAVAALGVRTACRAADWADPATFFRQTMASGGRNDRVSLNLACIYSGRGELRKAEEVLRETLRQYPDYPSARIALGANLIKQGRKAEGESFLKFSQKGADLLASAVPQTWTAAVNLAQSQYSQHHADVAVAILDDAVRRYPGIWEVLEFRAQILRDWKGPAAALPAVEEYAAAHWWHFGSHLQLGRLRAAAGDYAGGEAACRDAATLDIHSPEPFEYLAKAAVRANHLPEALEAQSEAIGRSPDVPHQYLALAAILNEMHQPVQALQARRKADLLRIAGAAGS